MSNIKDIRYQNFLKLIKEYGNIAKLSRLCGYTQPTYFYQIRGKKIGANGQPIELGNNVARKLEKATNKPRGWLDKEHSDEEFADKKTLAKKTLAKKPSNKKSLDTKQLDKVHSSSASTSFRLPENNGSDNIQTITLAFTGASGFPYGLRLLEVLLAAGKTVYLVYSDAAQIVAQKEADFALPESVDKAQEALCKHFNVSSQQLRVFDNQDWFAPIASGTAVADAMIICPASMGTVAAIVHGLSENLLQRAADVSIKEKRPLVIVPRETPLSSIHLQNLLQLSMLGCNIVPPCAGFYQKPQTVNDMIDFVVARILDQLHISHNLLPKWGN